MRVDTGTADVLVRKRDAVAQNSSLRSFADEDVREIPVSAIPVSRSQYWNIPDLLVSNTSLAAHEEVVWQNLNPTPNQ
jgi:hypothetical protein